MKCEVELPMVPINPKEISKGNDTQCKAQRLEETSPNKSIFFLSLVMYVQQCCKYIRLKALLAILLHQIEPKYFLQDNGNSAYG